MHLTLNIPNFIFPLPSAHFTSYTCPLFTCTMSSGSLKYFSRHTQISLFYKIHTVSIIHNMKISSSCISYINGDNEVNVINFIYYTSDSWIAIRKYLIKEVSSVLGVYRNCRVLCINARMFFFKLVGYMSKILHLQIKSFVSRVQNAKHTYIHLKNHCLYFYF